MNYNEEYVEDLDANLEQRKALIEEAKQLQEGENTQDVFKKVADLKKKWKRIPYWESAIEDELEQEFESCFDSIYASRKELEDQVKANKEAIIAEAKTILGGAKGNMNELLEKWKQAGRSSKEADDALWAEFNDVRQAYFNKKHEDWENLQAKFKDAKAVKEALIEEAKKLSTSTEFKKTTEAYKELMDKWKAAGRAGKEFDDALWAEFNTAKQVFFDAKEAFYANLKEEQAVNLEKKKALIEKAKDMLASNTYTAEMTNAMKELRNEWKAIGNAGRKADDEVWNEFSSTINAYFDQLAANREERQQKWLDHMNDLRNRKANLIASQKRQIAHLEQEARETLSETMVKNIELEIEDKKQFITELEAQLQELEEKINK